MTLLRLFLAHLFAPEPDAPTWEQVLAENERTRRERNRMMGVVRI